MARTYSGVSRETNPPPVKRALRWLARLLYHGSKNYPSVVFTVTGLPLTFVILGRVAGALAGIIALAGVALAMRETNRLNAWWNFRLGFNWFTMCEKLTMSSLGWRRVAQNGRTYYPVREKVTWLDGVLEVQIHQLPLGMEDKSWPLAAMEESMRGALGFLQGKVFQSNDEADRVTFRMSFRPMPTGVPLETWMFEVGPEMVPVGKEMDGTTSFFNLATTPHTMVAGETDFGKSGWARNCLIGKAVWEAWEVLIIDGKGVDYGWAAQLGCEVLTAEPTGEGFVDSAQLHGHISSLMHRMNRRRWLMGQMGVGENWSEFMLKFHWLEAQDIDLDQWLIDAGFSYTTSTGSKKNDDYEEHLVQLTWEDVRQEARILLVLMDEFGSIMRAKGKTGSQDRAHKAFAMVAQQCRAFGIRLVVLAQRPDVKDFGEYGGQARAQFRNRLAFGALDTDGLQMVFEARKDYDIALAARSRVKGRGAAFGLVGQYGESSSGDVRQIQAPWAEETEVLRILLEHRPELFTIETVAWMQARYEHKETVPT